MARSLLRIKTLPKKEDLSNLFFVFCIKRILEVLFRGEKPSILLISGCLGNIFSVSKEIYLMFKLDNKNFLKFKSKI